MSEEILKCGNLYYLQKIDKNVSEQMYEPVSYEHWKMLRDLEPSKFLNDYDFYVKSKKEQFELDLERRSDCELVLNCQNYSLHPGDINRTKQVIKDIQSNERFVKWYPNNGVVELILNYQIQTITSNGRIYNKEALKEEYDKLVVAYKDRTDLDIEHPGPLPKLKWWQKLFNIKPKQR